jgi:hypothetical protein
MAAAWRGGKVLSSGVAEFNRRLSGNFTNARNPAVMRGEFSVTPIENAFTRRRGEEHYWTALCFVETTLVQRPDGVMQKRRSL